VALSGNKDHLFRLLQNGDNVNPLVRREGGEREEGGRGGKRGLLAMTSALFLFVLSFYRKEEISKKLKSCYGVKPIRNQITP
jgi:hypothetical protein